MTTGSNVLETSIACVGGGIVGLVAALRLSQVTAHKGERLAFIALQRPSTDPRTTAILAPSIARLKELGVWDDIEAESAPLKTMRLIDGSNRLLRAPVADFRSTELGQDQFGFNVPNAAMVDRLEKRIAADTNIDRFDALVDGIELEGGKAVLSLSNGQVLAAHTVVAADGRHSKLREAAGITTRQWRYPQTALVLSFTHTLDHEGISTEFHRKTGPFTQVPLPPKPGAPRRSSLVWVVDPGEVDDLMAADNAALARCIEQIMGSYLGKVTLEVRPQAIELSGMTANRFAAQGVALVGEAAHVFPPIGAQGFNLGLRDVMALAQALEDTPDLTHTERALTAYDSGRRSDVLTRTGGVDLLNRSLLSNFLPVQAARVAGLSALAHLSPLRKLAMKAGLGDSPLLPSPSSVVEKGRAAMRRWQ